MDRIRSRRGWLLALLLTAIGAVWLGQAYLFVGAACPRLQNSILYAAAGMGIIVALLYALITRNNAPVWQLTSVVGLFGGILLAASAAGAIVGRMPEAQLVYCAPDVCDKAQLARNLRMTGKLDGAEDVARTCLGSMSAGGSESGCEGECGKELALALFDKAGQTLDSLPEQWSSDKQAQCDTAAVQLEEALTVANQFDDTNLVRSIEERQQRTREKCVAPPTLAPTASPTPSVQVEVLRVQKTDERALIDVRIVENSQPRRGLPAGDFTLTAAGQSVGFEFEERQADDPVCLIAVVDNSGSIYSGREQIRAALRKFNDLRKPGDELGLVVFAERNTVKIEQYPATDPLNPDVVRGSGNLTALWDGMLEGLEAAKSCSEDHDKILVALTDGRDNDSRRLEGDNQTKARLVAGLAAEQGVDVCTVGVQSDQLDPDVLRSAVHGCGYYHADDFDALASVFTDLFGYVRDFYRLSFTPDVIPPDGKVTLGALQAAEVTVDFSNP